MAVAISDSVIGCSVANRYTVEKLLGKGAFGAVYKVKDIKAKGSTDQLKALKEVDMRCVSADRAAQNKTLSEAQLQRDLDHPNVVRFFDSFYVNDNFYICTEFCEGGDLDMVIVQHKKTSKQIDEDQIWMWMIEIILGVKYIHKRGILHRDIKTRNIFLRNNIVKIGDFGISRVLSDTRTTLAHTCIGTPFYMCPEAISYMGYNHKSDIWSIGCVLYELAALQPAFEGENMYEVFKRITNVELPAWPKDYSKSLKELFLMIMQKDPEKRPSAGDLHRVPSVNEHCKKVEGDLQNWLEQANTTLKASSTASSSSSSKSHRSSMSEQAQQDVKDFWSRWEPTADRSASKAHKRDQVKIKVRVFEAVVDNGTASDIKNILAQFKEVMDLEQSGRRESLPVTMTEYDSSEDPFTAKAKTTKLETLKSEARDRLGSTYDKVYLYMKSARSPTSTKSEADITSDLSTYAGMSLEIRTIMEHIVLLEQQEKLAEYWATIN